MSIKKYWLHLLPIPIIYLSLGLIFYWAIDVRDPISVSIHKIFPKQLVTGEYFQETITYETYRSCFGEMHRKLQFKDQSGELVFYHLDETPFNVEQTTNNTTFKENIKIPFDVPTGTIKYFAELEFSCNPINKIKISLDPVEIDIK